MLKGHLHLFILLQLKNFLQPNSKHRNKNKTTKAVQPIASFQKFLKTDLIYEVLPRVVLSF